MREMGHDDLYLSDRAMPLPRSLAPHDKALKHPVTLLAGLRAGGDDP